MVFSTEAEREATFLLFADSKGGGTAKNRPAAGTASCFAGSVLHKMEGSPESAREWESPLQELQNDGHG